MAKTTIAYAGAEPRPGAARATRPRRRPVTRSARHHLTAHAYLAGALLCFTVFSWYPMLRGFVLSFQRTRRGETTWVGWLNFRHVLHDPSLAQAWENTAYFTVLALVLGYALPFGVAILLNELRHARGYLRALVYLPVMLPPASALFLFRYAYQPGEGGLFNYLLHTLHLPMSGWVQSPAMTVPSLVFASTWMNMGSAVLVYLAALQTIPGELYEAAELDGARLLRRIRHVTIPQTRLVLSLMLMLQVVATMQLFIEPLILAGGAGVRNSAVSVVYLMYQHAFYQNDLGGAAALGGLLFVALAGFSAIYVRLSPKQD